LLQNLNPRPAFAPPVPQGVDTGVDEPFRNEFLTSPAIIVVAMRFIILAPVPIDYMIGSRPIIAASDPSAVAELDSEGKSVLEWFVLLAWLGSWLAANGEFASGCGLPATGKVPESY
jgi:hypothetical protein